MNVNRSRINKIKWLNGLTIIKKLVRRTMLTCRRLLKNDTKGTSILE